MKFEFGNSNGWNFSMKMNGFYLVFGVITAIIGYHIHHSIFWAIMDCFVLPICMGKMAFDEAGDVNNNKRLFWIFL
jgi:hypothetical protein